MLSFGLQETRLLSRAEPERREAPEGRGGLHRCRDGCPRWPWARRQRRGVCRGSAGPVISQKTVCWRRFSRISVSPRWRQTPPPPGLVPPPPPPPPPPHLAPPVQTKHSVLRYPPPPPPPRRTPRPQPCFRRGKSPSRGSCFCFFLSRRLR